MTTIKRNILGLYSIWSDDIIISRPPQVCNWCGACSYADHSEGEYKAIKCDKCNERMATNECEINNGSSRMCEYGVKCCIKKHRSDNNE